MDKRMIAAVLGICALAAVMVPVTAEDVQGPAAVQTTANDRVYCVASVSKVYVTAAVMQLAEQGKVDLDAPVTEYVPNFRLDDERYKDITVRMLMDHTSGMEGSHERDWMLYADGTEPDYDEWLDELSHRRLKADPGAFAAYCNDGFTLLNIIVSNVSGMSYTDYLKENISDKIGAEHTGTFVDMYDDKDLVGVYKLGNAPHEFLYCLSPGSGGVCATAEDTAEFGSTFFKGDNRLLSEEVKDEMATRWDRGANDHTDGNGLGWDYVESLYYERSGIKVMGKGGDIDSTHAHLMVAPDEEVSVAVLTSGGSSTYDRMMCEALLDVVLEERGKTVDKTAPEITIADSLPEGIESYAGVYSNFSQLGGIGTIKLYFDDRHLYTSILGTGNSTPIIYSPTSDGGFVRVDENGNITASQEVMYFEERDGKVYIKEDSISAAPGLGEEVIKMYAAERIEENIISDAE
ncbi:MAG: beta-lactamase family protein, partial [Oscillospiraceae bacterium]|nr:beta-lactamase family protein [Oscillospiraceae bacterium]